MQFLQVKVKAQVDGTVDFGKRWVITKHAPHVTFFEIKVHESIVQPVIQWIYERSDRILDLVSKISFDHWHIFYKKKLNIAVLADRSFVDIDQAEEINPIVQERQQLLLDLFKAFDCTLAEQDNVEGLAIWIYRDSLGNALFSCSLYNRPEVWFPHVSVAVKFQQLEERHDCTAWPLASARSTRELFHEILNKV